MQLRQQRGIVRPAPPASRARLCSDRRRSGAAPRRLAAHRRAAPGSASVAARPRRRATCASMRRRAELPRSIGAMNARGRSHQLRQIRPALARGIALASVDARRARARRSLGAGRSSRRRARAAQDRALEPRAPARNPRARPPRRERMLQQASSGTGANSSAAASAMQPQEGAGRRLRKGWPAESSMAMSQRRSSAATRRARPRSGVTSAARAGAGSLDRRAAGAR